MTAYINNPALFTSKKALKEAIESRDGAVLIVDPSMFDDERFYARDMKIGQSIVVTNHPKRTKFAKITRTAKGYNVS